MDYSKLWPTLIGLIPLAAAVFTDAGSAYLAAHPTVAAAMIAINSAIANLVASPRKS
jgi:hypothetical protein